MLLLLLACTPVAPKGEPTETAETAETGEAPSWEGPNAVAPGRYVSALLWEEGAHHCARLTALELKDGGGLGGAGWTLCDEAWSGLAEVLPIGTSEQADAPADDADSWVMGIGAFVDESPAPLAGTWGHGDGDTEVVLPLDDGGVGRWRRTWHDDALMKLEPYEVARADEPGRTWLHRDEDGVFSRDATATVAGFAFGGPDAPSFEEPPESSLSALQEKNYTGRVCRYNGYYEPPADDEGCFADGLSLASVFYPTTTGVARYAALDGSMWVYGYLAWPGGEGLLGYRLAYQTSHDFNGDGNITEGGHTYAGLLIVDATGAQRGLVFADQSYDSGEGAVKIMSAMAYLDDGSAEAQDGVE